MKALSLIAIALVASGAAAQTPPLEFNGFRLGAPVADLMARMPGFQCGSTYCMLSPERDAKKACPLGTPNLGDCLKGAFQNSTWAGVTPIRYFASVKDGVIVKVSITVAESRFATITDGLLYKYGKPTSDSTEEAQNRMGAKFASRTVIWDLADGKIAAYQRLSTVDEAVFIMTTAAAAAAEAAADKDRGKRVADKL